MSQNRTTHGQCGRFRDLASEDQSDYDGLLERFMQAEKPADAVERGLVAQMARHTWLSERAIRLQEGCFLLQPRTPEQQAKGTESIAVMKDIAVYERYQSHHDRAYQRASSELAKPRKNRLLSERGFESQKRAAEEAKRREQRQNQRDELHSYKVANAKLRFEREQQRVFGASQPLHNSNSKDEPAVSQLGEDSKDEPAVSQLGEDSIKTAA